jgi:1A family penicillin-binding protein
MARTRWNTFSRGATRLAGATFRTLRLPVAWIPLLFVMAGGLGFGWGAWRNLCADCPSIAQIHTWEPAQTSKVFDRNGELIGEIGIEMRTFTDISSLPDHVPQAFIAVEDRRFYRHSGVDLRGFSRAVFGVLSSFSLSGGGGSTITQQLARNMFIESVGLDRSVARKLRELQVALELERAYTKDQILEAYMNQINLGVGIWGIHTASQRFFGKPPQEMTPAEAATLAAVANNPGGYNPFNHPDRSRARRNLVLDRMARERFLTTEEARQWKETPLPDSRGQYAESVGGYFLEMIRDQVMARWPGQVNTAGFHIHTTLDLSMQRAAERAMRDGFDRIERYPGFRHPRYEEYADRRASEIPETNSPYIQGALVSVDVRTGGIRALVGGRDIQHSKFNRATQARRQAGSAFKTFVYTAALQSGIPASFIVTDGPVVRAQADGSEWRPQNFDRTFDGDMTVRHAYRLSINTVAIKVADEEVGLETVAQTARRMGITTPIDRVPAMALGSADVIPIQMSEAYATLANLGVRTTPHAIVRVEAADGEVLWEPTHTSSRVLDPQVARLALSLMEEAVTRGTGTPGIRGGGKVPPEIPVGGKTGTTNDNSDVWFVGATPDLQTTVWFGMDRPQRIASNATGGALAAPVFGDFMRSLYVGDEEANGNGGGAPLLPRPEPWPMMELISRQVDDKTGLLASEWCPADRRYTEWYIPGTEPSEVCDESTRSRFPLRWW